MNWLLAFFLPLLLTSHFVEAVEPVSFSIFHTNDYHSHFRPDKGPLHLGGLARMKTAIDHGRADSQFSLLVDGGDWSEGQIYYELDTGREALRLMSEMGYDLAVVGNHDWLNGPDALLDAVIDSGSKTQFLSANLSLENYPRAGQFRKYIHPYVIREIGEGTKKVKIAFIGLATYELIYDRFFAPVKITEPFLYTRALAASLKKQVDMVVLISHNSLAANQKIAQFATAIDLVVGAHDHVKLTHPMVVERKNAPPAWMVEAGCWGQYLGRVDVRVTPRTPQSDPKVELLTYRLTQIDDRLPEDPKIAAEIETFEAQIENRFGNVFHDHVADSEIELFHTGIESPVGDIVTDAYREKTHADGALDLGGFIYGEFHAGEITSADVINTIPAVYDPKTSKSWTLKTIPMSGSALQWLFGLVYSFEPVSSFAMLAFSGFDIVYDNPLHPTASAPMVTPPEPDSLVRSVSIQGKPIDPLATYKIAISMGVAYGFEFIDALFPKAISLTDLKDTGLEDWRILEEYLRAHSPITSDLVPLGKRLHMLTPDLSLKYEDVSWKPIQQTEEGMKARVFVRIHNQGMGNYVSGDAVAHAMANRNGVDYALDPNYDEIGKAQTIPNLPAGQATVLSWDLTIPAVRGLFPITVNLEGLPSELNRSNNTITHWFRIKR